MSKQSSGGTKTTGVAPRAKRMNADARRRSILQAARRAFSENGDMNGTTIRIIAEAGGISEGIIYRHFESKDQLFLEAVVEPLREAVDELVAKTEAFDLDSPLATDRQIETLQLLYDQLIPTFQEVLPLLGLVLFGDPVVAQRFYQESFSVAMDRLADAWRDAEKRFGVEFGTTDISVRAVVGMALMVAMENRFNPRFDLDRATRLLATGTRDGFFPVLSSGGGER